MNRPLLAGDIGGTKIHLGLFEADGQALIPQRDQIYPTRDYPSLNAVVAQFLGSATRLSAACFGIPGPIIGHVSRPVNVPWEIDERIVGHALGDIPTRLINDLEATAWGTFHLRAEELVLLQAGAAGGAPANRVVIAAGTGLGEAGLVATPHGWEAIASEGGHADFAPRGAEQIRLLEFLQREFEHASFERVLSGPGLHNIYRFLMSESDEREPEWLVAQMRAEDQSAVISQIGLAGKFRPCARALEIFVEIYGAEAANLALKYLALGGVYIGGGIAPKILPALQKGGLIRAFLEKGRLRPTLEKIPVYVCLNENTALIGAAHAAASMLEAPPKTYTSQNLLVENPR